jgi:hypothetical protein
MAKRLSFTLTGNTDQPRAPDTQILNQDTTGTATNAINIVGGKTGCILYQEYTHTTTMLAPGNTNQILSIDKNGLPVWVDNTATNMVGGKAGQVLYQSNPNITTTTNTGKPGQALILDKNSIPTWTDIISNATLNVAGGKAGQVLYQSGSTTTSFTNSGTPGQILGLNKFGIPDWTDLNTTASNIIGGKAGQVLYQSGPNTTTTTLSGIPGQALLLNINGVPEWSDISTANITSSNNTSSTSGGTATGVFALKANTTGVGNAAYGYNSLKSNTTGSSNSSYGYNSLKSNAAGDSNTAFGSSTLQSNTNGSNNTAIGKQALQDSTGSGNIAINPCDSKSAYTPIFNPTTEDDRLCLGSYNITNAYVSVPWTTKADIRDQVNIEDLPYGLDFIAKLKPTQYQFTSNRESTTPVGIIRYGFSAQDVLEIDDSAHIIDNEDPNNLKINESSLIAILVKAIQELQAEVNLLKNNS